MFYDLETRKQNTKKLIKYFEALSLKITNDDRKKAGFVFLTAHTIVITIIMYLMLLTKKREFIIIGILLWVLIMMQHLYFKGCWAVRTEREIWQTKEWYGPWNAFFQIMKYYGIKLSESEQNLVFASYAITLTFVSTFRFILLAK